MTEINVIQTSDGYAKIRLHDFEAMQAEAERLRDEVRELKALQLRIWQAFSAADSTLRLRYAEDLRGAYSKDEAERLTRYMTGER